jgi:hypothetical protein
MELNPGEKDIVAERQENPNEEVTIHYPRACGNRTACLEATEANPENLEPNDRPIAILEKMEATELK